MTAADLVRERASRFGPIGFDEFLETALYAPGAGFYETGGRAGTDGAPADGGPGHFLTSPSLGPLFGAVIARALDRWWDDLGRPDPFVVAEAAAGTGELCRAVLAAAPACAPALRYLLVERSEALRARQARHLPVEPAAHVLGPVAPADDEDEDGARVLPGGGPRVASLPDLPASRVVGVVLANELIDNLPFVLLERGRRGWSEVRVDADVSEVLVPASAALAAEGDRFAPGAAPGARIPIQKEAAAWVRSALRTLSRGRLVVFDYAVDTTAQLAERPWTEWVRTYRLGGPGGAPLDRPGDQDVTCEVCVDQLARVAEPAAVRSQADFLAEHGIGDLVSAARQAWQEGAASGSLDAVKARSRISEADALLEGSGLGGFRVVEWAVG